MRGRVVVTPARLAELATVTDPLVLNEAGRLLAEVDPACFGPGAGYRSLRVAVIATFTADEVVPVLRALLAAAGIAPVIHLCPYDQVSHQLSDPGSHLHTFRPDVTLLLQDSAGWLPRTWNPADLDRVADEVRDRVAARIAEAGGFADRSGSVVLLHTVPLPSLERRTVISFRGAARLGRIWREANTALLSAGEDRAGVYTVDLEAALLEAPGPVRDERRYRYGRMAWARRPS